MQGRTMGRIVQGVGAVLFIVGVIVAIIAGVTLGKSDPGFIPSFIGLAVVGVGAIGVGQILVYTNGLSLEEVPQPPIITTKGGEKC